MNAITLRVETELDPSAAPRVFGYLGGLGHVPLHAILRRGVGETLLMEVRIESVADAAERISAKIEQMPFVLTSSLAASAAVPEGNPGTVVEASTGGIVKLNITGGMQHAPSQCAPRGRPRVDAAALRVAATQRMHAIRHRAWQLSA